MNRLEFLNKELGTNYKSLDKVNWGYISKCQKLSENFIREFQYKVNWSYISRYQKLSENFIGKFQTNVNWDYISEHQKLSENFIREFQNKIEWFYISKCQKLSEDFTREFQDKVYWSNILLFQNLSEDFIYEFKDKITWFYKSTDFKKQQIIDCGLYECYEDYFIAYKAIRDDRYSHFNFQYQYLPNQIYEAHCDCTDNEDSFGLSVWTNEGAKNYNNSGLIVKVKVKYEDVGRLVHDSNKIRCFKIEVLE